MRRQSRAVNEALVLEALGFIFVALLIWVNEYLDLPHLVFGSTATRGAGWISKISWNRAIVSKRPTACVLTARPRWGRHSRAQWRPNEPPASYQLSATGDHACGRRVRRPDRHLRARRLLGPA